MIQLQELSKDVKGIDGQLKMAWQLAEMKNTQQLLQETFMKVESHIYIMGDHMVNIATTVELFQKEVTSLKVN